MIWENQCMREIRAKYRIIGSLWGTKRNSRRDDEEEEEDEDEEEEEFVEDGLPMRLNSYEARLLVDLRVVEISGNTSGLICREKEDDDEIRREFNAQVEKSKELFRIQREKDREKREQIMMSGNALEIEKLQRRKRKREDLGNSDLVQKRKFNIPNLEHVPVHSRTYIGWEILSNVNADECPSLKLNCAPAKLATNPQKILITERDIECCPKKYAVFKDLWNRGYVILPGLRFGGDFVAYPGFPWEYHSQWIVIVSEEISPANIVSCARIAQASHKGLLLASVCEIQDKVSYRTIIWDSITSATSDKASFERKKS